MTKNLRIFLGTVAFGFALVAYADVARSASGTGESDAAATKSAQESAQSQYGNKIKSWGAKTCSTETQMRDDNSDLYKVKKVPVTIHRCVVEFTTTE